MAQIRFLPAASKFLKKIKDKTLQNNFKQAIKRISENPELGEAQKGDLAGIYCIDLYYNKTNYELAYTFYRQGEEIIVIIFAGTRENFYQSLKNYIKTSSL